MSTQSRSALDRRLMELVDRIAKQAITHSFRKYPEKSFRLYINNQEANAITRRCIEGNRFYNMLRARGFQPDQIRVHRYASASFPAAVEVFYPAPGKGWWGA